MSGYKAQNEKNDAAKAFIVNSVFAKYAKKELDCTNASSIPETLPRPQRREGLYEDPPNWHHPAGRPVKPLEYSRSQGLIK